MWDQAATFWTNNGSQISQGAIVLSAVAAVFLIVVHRQSSRKSNTLSFILKCQTDGDIIDSRRSFIEATKSGHRSSHYAKDDLDKDDRKKADAIRTILNLNELVAVSILEGSMDERVYRRWFNRGFIRDYEDMTGYIDEVRTKHGNRALFKEFEGVAKSWREDITYYAPPGFFARKWRAILAFWKA